MEQELMFKKLLTADRAEMLGNARLLAIYEPGSNVVEGAADVLRLLGHNMPPVEE
jgi:methylmalonyl-CoA mutase